MRRVHAKDKAEATEAIKRIYNADDAQEAQARLDEFLNSWGAKYPRLKIFFDGKTNLFSYFSFPQRIRRSLYTNNLAESIHKRIKRIIKSKEQFPNEDALARTVCASVLEYNAKAEGRIHRGLANILYEIQIMFE